MIQELARHQELNEYESLRTIHAVIFQIGFALVGLIVIATALLLPWRYAGYSGVIYSLNGVVGFTLGAIQGKRERLAIQRMEAKPAAAANS